MLAVVDTNVWVSAFITPGGTAAKLLEAVRHGRLALAYSREIEAEYSDVLARPKFDITPELVAEFLDRLHAEGRWVDLVPPLAIALPDPDDASFLALARHMGCPLITGNTRHFPAAAGVEVLTPGAWVARVMRNE